MQVSDHFLQPGIPQQFIQLILPDAEFYPPAGLIVVVDHSSPVISVFLFFAGILGGRGTMEFCRFVNSNAFIDRAVQKFVGSEKRAVRAEDIESGSSEGMIQIVEKICVDQLRVIRQDRSCCPDPGLIHGIKFFFNVRGPFVLLGKDSFQILCLVRGTLLCQVHAAQHLYYDHAGKCE